MPPSPTLTSVPTIPTRRTSSPIPNRRTSSPIQLENIPENELSDLPLLEFSSSPSENNESQETDLPEIQISSKGDGDVIEQSETSMDQSFKPSQAFAPSPKEETLPSLPSSYNSSSSSSNNSSTTPKLILSTTSTNLQQSKDSSTSDFHGFGMFY